MRWTRILLSASAVVALSAFWADAARAQRPGGFGFGGFGQQNDPISLLRNANVRKELEIEAEQEKQITAVQKEMATELEASRKAITVKYQDKIDKALQPQQVERLHQISLQLRGVEALADPEISRKLSLSEDQLKEIAAKHEEGQKKAREVTGFDREAFTKRNEIQAEADKAAVGVLSESQQKQYETMKGKEFDRSLLRQGRKKASPDT